MEGLIFGILRYFNGSIISRVPGETRARLSATREN